MKKIVIALAALLLALPAMAQTGAVEFDAPWSPLVKTDAHLIPLRSSLTGAVSEIPGQTQPINISVGLTPTVNIVTFPGQKTSAMTITGFRVKGTATASWKMALQPDQMLPAPIVVPAGKSLMVRMEFSLLSLTGSFRWAPDLAGLSGAPPVIPPPAVTPPPVVTPPPPIPVPPSGSTLTVSSVLIGADGKLVAAFFQNAPCILPFTISNSSSVAINVTWADQINQLLDLVPKAHLAPVAIPANGSTAFTLTCDSKTKGTFGGTGTITSTAAVLSLPISWTVQ